MSAKKMFQGVLILILLALAGGGWLHWRRVKNQERAGLWSAYLKGPLTELVEARELADPIFKTQKIRKTQYATLSLAVQGVRRSWKDAMVMKADWDEDAFFEDLSEGARLHGELSLLADEWPRVDWKDIPMARTARDAETGFLQSLIVRVQAQREKVLAASLPVSEEEKALAEKLLAALRVR